MSLKNPSKEENTGRLMNCRTPLWLIRFYHGRPHDETAGCHCSRRQRPQIKTTIRNRITDARKISAGVIVPQPIGEH